MKVSRDAINRFVLGASAFVLSGAVLGMFLPSQGLEEGNPTFKFILATLYLAVGIMAFGREQLRQVARNPALLALLILTCLSALWATTPALSLQRSLAVIGASLVGVVLVTRFTMEEQLRLLSWVFRLGAALSAICIIVAPGLAFADGAAQGVFNHKNVMGDIMALAILVEYFLPATGIPAKIAKGMWLGAYLVLLILSKSATSLIAVFFTLLIIRAFTALRARLSIPLALLIPVVVLAVSFAAFIFVGGESLFRMLGRSSDLTGRTELWGIVVTMIFKKPLLGYGYSSFWGGAAPESSIVESEIGWTPLYSHNGYLETLLSLGLVGFVLLLIVLAMGFRRALLAAENGQAAYDMWPLAFLVFFVIHNLGECTILWQNSLEWALCIAVVIGSDQGSYETAAEPAYEVKSFESHEYV
jgi:exopolysaccharide production protein ExoQ